MDKTTYGDKCSILAQLWIEFRNDEEFKDFIEYNDLGLPLAYAVANEAVVSNDITQALINETYDLLLGALGIDDDTGFTSLDELLDIASEE